MAGRLSHSQILLMLEGDVSDLELEDELEEDEDSSQSPEEEGPGTEEQAEQIGVQIGLPVEVLNGGEQDDAAAAPEQVQQQQQPGPVRWRHRDLDPSNTACDAVFSEPDAVLSALSYFKMFITDEMVNNMVEQTNLYSVQKTGVSIATSELEMRRFLGMHIMMGIIKLPQLIQYWQNHLRIPFVADTMPRNRFMKLRQNLHFNDNSQLVARGQPGHDKLFKIRPFVNALRQTFLSIEPEEFNSVDEMIIPFKGRSSLKQYVKNKPHKWGIKVFARAGVSGIVYDFEIYTGKDTNVGERSTLGISGDIVVRLCEHLPLHRNFKLSTDNWFSSYRLAVKLKCMGICFIGTVRSNRLQGCSFRSDAEMKRSGRGTHDHKTEAESSVFACKWYDNKCVHFISSYAGVEPVGCVRRWSQNTRTYIDVVAEYNKYMGGVYLNDMLVALYRIDLRSKRYYLRIVFHFIDISIVNAWLLYRRHCRQLNEKQKPLAIFRAEIARALMSQCDPEERRRRGRPSESTPPPTPTLSRTHQIRPIDDVRFSGWGHFPDFHEKAQRCKKCIKGQTKVYCCRCEVHLCFTPGRNCFKDFHNRDALHSA